MVPGHKFHVKIAKVFDDFLGHFEILHFQVKTAVSAFLGNFWQHLATIFIPSSGHTDSYP